MHRLIPPALTRLVPGLSLALALGMTALPSAASAAPAPFPDRPIRLLVGFPPGGGVDVAARTLANVLTRELGQSVVVENLAGAGGNIATDRVVKSDADGYTLLFSSIALAINPALYQSLTFDPTTQLRAVSMVSTSPFILLANADAGIGSAKELVDKAKAGMVDYASAGNGSGSHLFMQQFSALAGVQMTHIPYKGAAPALNDVLANRVPVVFDSVMTTLPHIQSGRLKPLGLSSMKKSAIAPDIPTLDEAGIKGMDSTSWFIVFAPSGTDEAVVNTVNAAIGRAQNDAGLRRSFAAMGADIAESTPAQAQAFYASEVTKWADAVKAAGVKLD